MSLDRQLVFGVSESMVRAPFYELRVSPEKPFALEDEPSTMPWTSWTCDRFVTFFDHKSFNENQGNGMLESTQAFFEERTVENAQKIAKELQCAYSFDGALAFIPQSHAEDFYTFFENVLNKGLIGLGDRTIEVNSEDFNLGSDMDDPVAYWQSSNDDGIFLLFAESCDSGGEDWFESAFLLYPRRDEITAPQDTTEFDPKYAFLHQDCHLGDHLYPSRHKDNPLFGSFLRWANEKGYLNIEDR